MSGIPFGISVDYKSVITPSIRIKSNTRIAILTKASVSKLSASIKYYSDAEEAIHKLKDLIKEGIKEAINVPAAQATKAEQYKEQESIKALKTNVLLLALNAILAQGLHCPIIISVKDTINNAASQLDDFETKANIVILAREAITTLANTYEGSYITTLKGYLNKNKSIAIIDTMISSASLESNCKTLKGSGTSKRVYLIHQSNAKVIDDTGTKHLINPSPFVAAAIAKNDIEQYGFSTSMSFNKIEGLASAGVEFIMGETCLANKLRENNINSIISFQGFRIWGDNSFPDTANSQEAAFSDIRRLRIVDVLTQSVSKSILYAIDQKAINIMHTVRLSVENFCAKLKSNSVLLGFEIYWDKTKNTIDDLKNGTFFLDIKVQEVPTMKKLRITCDITDEFTATLLK